MTEQVSELQPLPHVQRMQTELKDLDEKITKLNAFVASSDVYKALGSEDQDLLKQQVEAMQAYASILANRISRA